MARARVRVASRLAAEPDALVRAASALAGAALLGLGLGLPLASLCWRILNCLMLFAFILEK